MRDATDDRLTLGGPEPKRYFAIMAPKARLDAIEQALSHWSKLWGSAEKFAAARAIVVTTRVTHDEWTVTVAAVPLAEVPKPRSAWHPDDSFERVEVLVGPAALRPFESPPSPRAASAQTRP